jgi:fatty acid amide hydrolase 2
MLFDVAMAIFGRFARLIGFNSFEKLDNLRQQFVEYLDGGVLLLPVFMHAVPKHGWTYRSLIRPPFTPIFNALGFPGVVLPICRDDNGLPLAVQIVAPPGDDEKALAVAAHLERVFGGWQPAEKL